MFAFFGTVPGVNMLPVESKIVETLLLIRVQTSVQFSHVSVYNGDVRQGYFYDENG